MDVLFIRRDNDRQNSGVYLYKAAFRLRGLSFPIGPHPPHYILYMSGQKVPCATHSIPEAERIRRIGNQSSFLVKKEKKRKKEERKKRENRKRKKTKLSLSSSLNISQPPALVECNMITTAQRGGYGQNSLSAFLDQQNFNFSPTSWLTCWSIPGQFLRE